MTGFIIKESYRAIRKAKLYFIFSLLTTTIGIFLIQSSLLLSRYIDDLRQELSRSLTVQIFLEDAVTPQQSADLEKFIKTQQIASSTVFISKKDAEALFVKETGENFRHVLDYNPLPASYNVIINAKNFDKGKVDRFISEVRRISGVSDVGFEQKTFQNILEISQRAEKYVLLIALILILIAMYIVFTMSVVIIDSRSEEIKIMRLVGSSRFLIGAPIIVNGLLVGVLSAGLAAGIWTTAEKLTRHPSIALPLMPPVAPIMVMGIGIGFLIGLLSSLLALLRVQKWR